MKTPSPVEKKLSEYKKTIDPLITDYLDEKIKKYHTVFPESRDLISQIKNLTLRGGDRIRPMLFYCGFTLVRIPEQTEKSELYRLSIAFEIFHSFALIHDDIIDGSLKRRGDFSVNAFFDKKYGICWGDRLAILSGDLANIFSEEIFHSCLFTDTFKNAQKIFYLLKEEVAVGEYIDTILPVSDGFPSLEKIRDMLCFKSGFYSIEKPLIIGATLAGTDERRMNALSIAGKKLGLAFQIRDDILGIFGNPQVTGKPTDEDIIEGKRTLLISSAYSRLKNSADKAKFKNLLEKRSLKNEEIDWIKETVKISGALDYCRNLSQKLVYEAKKLITETGFNQGPKSFLLELSDFLIEREY